MSFLRQDLNLRHTGHYRIERFDDYYLLKGFEFKKTKAEAAKRYIEILSKAGGKAWLFYIDENGNPRRIKEKELVFM